TNLDVDHFLSQVRRLDPETVTVASSNEPRTDDVFRLLQLGARGFLVFPFTSEALDESMVFATKGKPIPEHVLQAVDRNVGFVALIASAIDRAAEVLKYSVVSEKDMNEVPVAMASLRRTVETARLFGQ